MDTEKKRLQEQALGEKNWYLWGPYLSERQWGTVREDYSPDGEPWGYFPFEHAHRRAYRWGEDGIAGICDDQQQLCFSLALWNGKDEIIKERLFGLTNEQGNHGEDVKELYYYLDATPSHSYLKYLYKYPQTAFPYHDLVAENGRRSRQDHEYEILDTGIFDADRYFDVEVEYAKQDPENILIVVTIHNRGPEEASLHILPQLWFRNTWSWSEAKNKPELYLHDKAITASHPDLGDYFLKTEDSATALFCDNETNAAGVFAEPLEPGFFKDGFHDYLIDARNDAVNPEQRGTRAAWHYEQVIPAGEHRQYRLHLGQEATIPSWKKLDTLIELRRKEADIFYSGLPLRDASPERRAVQRQALASLIWSKQFYHYDVYHWLQGDPAQPNPPAMRKEGRNHGWQHLHACEVLSMPDAWEFPWFASWDLALQCIPLALIDPAFAKAQLIHLTGERYMDLDGEIPAYEWAFSEANPPVYALAALKIFELEREQHGGSGDLQFLERVFHKLMLNFSWWVNRKDQEGRNLFQGGFLGLDNIGVFDRRNPNPAGGRLDQADGTSWMAMYCLNLMRMALELALHNPSYEDIAIKFFEHFLGIADSISNLGGPGVGLWDEEAKFFYSMLNLPDGRSLPIKAHTLVSLIPLLAVEVISGDTWKRLPEFERRLQWYQTHRPDLCRLVSSWQKPSADGHHLLALLRDERMKCVITEMLDESRFLSDFGIRSVSRQHRDQPYELKLDGEPMVLDYQPGESTTNLFGGNSNWRGPIWFPINFLIIEALRKFHRFYGEDYTVEYPSHSGNYLDLNSIADKLSERMSRLFIKDRDGNRPAFAHYDKLQQDPHFRDHLLFHEFFHAETGRGCGASHQTGWTALVAAML